MAAFDYDCLQPWQLILSALRWKNRHFTWLAKKYNCGSNHWFTHEFELPLVMDFRLQILPNILGYVGGNYEILDLSITGKTKQSLIHNSTTRSRQFDRINRHLSARYILTVHIWSLPWPLLFKIYQSTWKSGQYLLDFLALVYLSYFAYFCIDC